MPDGRGCPPGRDFKEEDCSKLNKKVSSWKFGNNGKYKGFLPKCFLWDGKRVYYNRLGKVPPTDWKNDWKNRQKAICKKQNTATNLPTTTTTTTTMTSTATTTTTKTSTATSTTTKTKTKTTTKTTPTTGFSMIDNGRIHNFHSWD